MRAASEDAVKYAVRSATCGVRTAWWRAAVVAVLAGVLVAGCSGGGDGHGQDVGTATATRVVSDTGTATASASSTLTATGTPAANSTAGGVTRVADPTVTVATATAVPPTATSVPATPTATPRPVEDGIFVVVVSQGGVSTEVRVEVAATLDERQRGLMFRKELAEDAGMLFLFGRDVQTGFWMRNTYLPLDIAYIGADRRVIEIKQGKPLDETPLTPGEKYLYVLEVNAGWFERHGMGPGAMVTLPGGLPAATDN